jgi:hypothetical protein
LKTPKKTAAIVGKLPVSEGNVGKAAMRLLSQRLVSTEVAYVQRVLGNTASQSDIDAQVIAVRKLPWASIVIAD